VRSWVNAKTSGTELVATYVRLMSTFSVEAREITILPHPDADALELAQIDDYRAVVRKGEFSDGDMAIYIPEASILPEALISELGLEGALAGGTFGPDGKKLRDRVKAIRLRGELSQGLVFRPTDDGEYASVLPLTPGVDYAEALGISKWAPPIPLEMAGEAEPCPALISYTDIENIKRFPDAIVAGEPVLGIEKLHGSCCVFLSSPDGNFHVSSKGNASAGRGLKPTVDEDGKLTNVYWRAAEAYGLSEKMAAMREKFGCEAVHVYGEVLGVQDLRYGLTKGQLEYRVFDIRVDRDFLDAGVLAATCEELGLPMPAVLYDGPYDREEVEAAAVGPEQLTGTESHIREGLVLRPLHERLDSRLGRVIVKVISPDYLLRKGNATEYE
jgi:RNA ligase (TIGR02306 family)